MTKLRLLLASILLLIFASAHAQEIPKGVNYKRASDALNEKAKKSLESALTISDSLPTDFFGEVTVIGAMLWHTLKPTAPEVLLKGTPTILVVPGPRPFQAESARVLSDEERKAFWILLHAKFPKLKNGKIRKANAQEIAYYWSTIPFDIQEPFLVIEAGDQRFITNFLTKDEQPRLFWIDLVGDLETLRPK